jgi:hypothetical protein
MTIRLRLRATNINQGSNEGMYATLTPSSTAVLTYTLNIALRSLYCTLGCVLSVYAKAIIVSYPQLEMFYSSSEVSSTAPSSIASLPPTYSSPAVTTYSRLRPYARASTDVARVITAVLMSS